MFGLPGENIFQRIGVLKNGVLKIIVFNESIFKKQYR